MPSGSAHKVHRNNHYRVELSGSTFITSTVYDNGFLIRVLPFYKESISWLKSYLPSTTFIQYVLYSSTYTGSTFSIPQQAVSINSSPAYYEYRLAPDNVLYDNLNYKSYQTLRLSEKAKVQLDKKNTQIYFEINPIIHNKTALGGKYFDSVREPPLDYASELIKYNIDSIIDGFTPVFEKDFAHEILNRYYNVQNRNKKYEKLETIFKFNGNVKIVHKQTVYPNQNDIWSRVRPYFTFSSWISNQTLRMRPVSFEYEYSGEGLDISPSIKNGNVNTLLISGSNIYVGGAFSLAYTSNRLGFAALNKSSGTLLPIISNLLSSEIINCFCLINSNLYIGGLFTTVSGSVRNNIAVIDKDSGALGPFNPNANSTVRSIISSGSNLYIGGNFTTVSGTTRNKIAVVDKDSGALGPFNPSVTAGGTQVYTLLISGSNLYVGGYFDTISGSTRNNIAVVDKDSGALGPFNPSVTGLTGIRQLLISGSNLYIGGNFTGISGSTRNGLGVVNKDSGDLGPFNPDVSGQSGGGIVEAMIFSGSNLYIGGNFTNVSGTFKKNIASVNKDSGVLSTQFNAEVSILDIENISFNTNETPSVFSMLLDSDRIYLGGNFKSVNLKTRNNFAVIDSTSGTLINFATTVNTSSLLSIWPLDAWKNNENFIFGEYLTGSIIGFPLYERPFRFLFYPLIDSCWTGSYISSSSIWTVPYETNSFPFFDSELDFIHKIKPKYKDYTQVPEYIISNFINDYSLNTGSYDIYISGTTLIGQQLFSTNGFDIKNIFDIKKDIKKNVKQVFFKLNYVNLFRPYRNLYPVEKILQISKILSNVLESGTLRNFLPADLLPIESKSLIRNFLLEPFVSPGIIWNTIKTGVPSVYPYYTGSDSNGFVTYSGTTYFPFESILNPFKYLNNTLISPPADFPLVSSLYKSQFSGSSNDEKYTDCIYNFIKDSQFFFLETEPNLRYFSSKPEKDFSVFIQGNTYSMMLSLDNYFNTSSSPIASSISASPRSLGFYNFVGDTAFSPYVPPYLGYYKENILSSSVPTFNKVKISFTPPQTGKYTLGEILSCSVLYKEITDQRWSNTSVIESMRNLGQDLNKSYNLFEFEKISETDKIWNISGKWEVPIFNFRNSVSKQKLDTYPYLSTILGYGHQFGFPQDTQSSLSLNISDVTGTFSLADAVGFQNRTYKLGKIKNSAEVFELICIVPFNNKFQKFITIDRDSNNYKKNLSYFDYYLFPKQYDYKNGISSPFLMYCFETKMVLHSNDLSKIWQNVMPSQSFNHEEGFIILEDNDLNNNKFNEIFEDDISWIIFKVKQKSITNFIKNNHTFNWPYENFSITELVKLEVDLVYNDIINIEENIDPSTIGRKFVPINKEIFNKDFTIERKDFPSKGEESKREFPSKGETQLKLEGEVDLGALNNNVGNIQNISSLPPPIIGKSEAQAPTISIPVSSNTNGSKSESQA